MEARGKTFQAKFKALIPPFSLAYKKRVYSTNWVMYPLKRVDFDLEWCSWLHRSRRPQHPEPRQEQVKRISWEEALDIVESEIKRVHKKYGVYAVLPQWGGHGEVKVVHNPHGYPNALLDLLGGYTYEVRNPDSWEGWHWGAMHVWGMPMVDSRPGELHAGHLRQRDAALLGLRSRDHSMGSGRSYSDTDVDWFKELGIDSVEIRPDLNYGAANSCR